MVTITSRHQRRPKGPKQLYTRSNLRGTRDHAKSIRNRIFTAPTWDHEEESGEEEV